MKQIILFITLTFLVNRIDAMNKAIVLPSQEELNSRLCSLGLEHFAQTTKIHEELGNKTIRPVNIVKIINSRLDNYCTEIQNEAFTIQINASRPVIIEEFFKERPEIVTFLGNMDLLQSREARY